MTLKVTGGVHKGSKITSPKEIARPTTSMLRQALFNIASNKIENANFLDLFAGSGIMGIEAVSRMAKLVVFVEKSKKNISNIKKNLTRLQINKNTQVICNDVFSAIKYLKLKFDIVFMDPPYQLSNELIPKTLNALIKFNILHENASIFVETAKDFQIDILKIDHIQHLKSKNYGNSALHQFQYLS